MALKVELKPGERILIGDCVITNADQHRTRLVIEGEAPILRGKDILTPERANTPARRLYLAILLMYTARRPQEHHEIYFALMRDILQAAPSTRSYFAAINHLILTGNVYKALKEAKKLIAYEQELMHHAQCSASLRTGRQADRKSA
jgi:flagellar protein FlbT